MPTLAERLRERDDASAVEVEAGVINFTSPDASRVAAAVEAAARADVVVLALGAGLETVDEKEDLYGLGLPGAQDALAAAVAAVGKPTAAVLVMGNQYAIDAWLPDVPAVLDAFVPSSPVSRRVATAARMSTEVEPDTNVAQTEDTSREKVMTFSYDMSMEEKYELTVEVVGPDENQTHEVRVLNRVLR